ncbi:MAG: hypothetical protein J2P57_10870 [Acidimicrobiaceae bacterium]|nr:hypothetical protein [Acidimicrobiaceae bacterium]
MSPGTTTIAISCTGLTPSATFAVADASPLADVLSGGGLLAQLNLTMGFALGSSDANGNFSTTFTVPATTVAANSDGTCPPTQAQVDAGLNNCAVAVANISTGVDEGGFALLNYPGQPTPDPATLTLSPASGPRGTTVTVSGSNWWGNGTGGTPSISASHITVIARNSNGGTLGGLGRHPRTSAVTVPASVYTPGTGPNGSGGTLTGGNITGTFTIPFTAPKGADRVVITEPNPVPAGDPPYSHAKISAASGFRVLGLPG